MIALDCETTGVDFRHGARPFFVTVCDDEGKQQYWQWDVDPKTRQVSIPQEDIEEIAQLIDQVSRRRHLDDEMREDGCLVLQNAKFDAAALESIGIAPWPWDMTRDTLVAAHLLSSNTPHNLTALLMELQEDIRPWEDRLEKAVTAARTHCKKYLKDWMIAKEGLPSMPSVKGSKSGGKKTQEKDRNWKNDSWLPRALAKHLGYAPTHPWHSVLAEYSNVDSAATIHLWQWQREQLKGRHYWRVYLAKMRSLVSITSMERRGVTVSGVGLEALSEEFKDRSEMAEAKMVLLADQYGYDLCLPRGGVNDNLRQFVFDVLKLPPVYNPKAKSDKPSLDKSNAIPYWLATLPTDCDERRFLEDLLEKRAVDVAQTFLTSYRRFWLPLEESSGWYRLHPSYNPTGTDTLRGSMNNPNGQQISKKEKANVRKCFGPAPGREWWSLDAKNIELRIPAYESGEKDLIDLFERMNEPPYYGSQHLLNFSTVYPDIWEKVLAEVGHDKVGPECKKKYEDSWYQWCKNGDFAIQYNCGEATADKSFHRKGAYRALKSRFSKLERHNQWCIAQARKMGYVETIPDRSVDPSRGYPLIVSRSDRGEVLPTTPLNYRTSGSACWWMVRAMDRCHDQLEQWREEEFDAWIALQIHDELVFDLPKGRGTEPWRTNLPAVRKLQRLMEQGGEDIGIPTPVTVEYHAVSWADGLVMK